jgi:signal transduction histidine kinase
MHLIHDVRLVLVALKACLQLLRTRGRTSRQPAELDQADRLVDLALTLVDELLVSRDRKAVAPHFDVNAIIETLDAVVMTLAGPHVGVSTRLGSGNARVYAQRGDIERILLNLAFNAVAAMPSGGTLLIDTDIVNNAGATDSRFGNLLLTIRDTGHGMSDVDLGSAVDPQAAPRPDGSGLGLASIALILTRLGGRMIVESEPDKGTLVSILIPLADGGHQVH